MTPSRHFRGGEPVRLRDGRVVTIRAEVVAPVEILRCVTEAGHPVDVARDRLTWDTVDRCWIEREGT